VRLQIRWAKFAWSSLFAAWNVGAGVFAFNPPGKFQAKEQLKMIERYKVSTFCAPPTVLRMLIQEDLAAYSFSFRDGPFEVESVLLEHPAVMESAVVGSPHAVRGNEIKAFVILTAGYVPEKKLADGVL
jgi:acyl-coenzyme A synthetase/AMP-(fatty) acid ligase